MKKIIYLLIPFFYFATGNSLEKTKEEKVAKFVLENMQKDYTSCYGFYKITGESFKKSNTLPGILLVVLFLVLYTLYISAQHFKFFFDHFIAAIKMVYTFNSG